MLIVSGFTGDTVSYANTIAGLAEKSGVSPAFVVTDCNRNDVLANLRCIADVWRVVRTVRPEVVVSTGAAPGLIGLVIGKIHGAKCVWVDSVANSERLSLSGKLARFVADIWLTQWEHLAVRQGPGYLGSVL